MLKAAFYLDSVPCACSLQTEEQCCYGSWIFFFGKERRAIPPEVAGPHVSRPLPDHRHCRLWKGPAQATGRLSSRRREPCELAAPQPPAGSARLRGDWISSTEQPISRSQACTGEVASLHTDADNVPACSAWGRPLLIPNQKAAPPHLVSRWYTLARW